MQDKHGTTNPGRVQLQSAGAGHAVDNVLFDVVAAAPLCRLSTACHDLPHAAWARFSGHRPALSIVPHPDAGRHGSGGDQGRGGTNGMDPDG